MEGDQQLGKFQRHPFPFRISLYETLLINYNIEKLAMGMDGNRPAEYKAIMPLHCNLEAEFLCDCLSLSSLPQADEYDHDTHCYSGNSQASHYG